MKVCHYQRHSKENAANTEGNKKKKQKGERKKAGRGKGEREVGNKDIYTGNASLGQVHGLLR